MNLNWSNRVIKYVLFVFNLLFVISGIIMIAVGVSVKSYYTDYDIFLNDSYFSLPNLLIAIGSLIFFISFFGCCGAIRESWLMIFIFAILLSIIFIMEFSAGIAGYVLRDKTTSYLTEKLKESMKNYEPNTDNASATTIMWDEIQETFQCCGASSPDDWKGKIGELTTTAASTSKTPTTPATTEYSLATTTTPNPTTATTTNSVTSTTTESVTSATTNPVTNTSSTNPASSTGTSPTTSNITSDALGGKDRTQRSTKGTILAEGDLPGSCCKPKPGATGQITCNKNSNRTTYYEKGCVEGFGAYLKDHAVTIGGVGLAIAFIQLFAVIFACHLSKQLKHGFYST